MFIYNYKGYWGFDSKCGVEIKRDNDKVTVILTELPDNPGTSVTNMIEHLATMIYHQFLKDVLVENITWIEHYIESFAGETFDKVKMEWDGQRFKNPKWERIKKKEI